MLLSNKSSLSNFLSKLRIIGILTLTFILIFSGFVSVAMIPGQSIVENTTEHNMCPDANPRSARSARTVEYDMNTSRPGLHQVMTIYGWREILSSEVPPELKLIENVVTGDIDGDGLDDIIISSSEENIFPREDCGVVYIIFGVPILPNIYDMNAHTNLTIIGASAGDGIGSALAIGDINNDTINDIAVGAAGSDTVHVFYGGSYLKTMTPPWDLGAPSSAANITIFGTNLDSFGSSLAMGDLDKDNIDDLIIGAPTSQGKNDAKVDCGEIYVIKGEDNITNSIDFSQPSPPTNINFSIVYGVDPNDRFGSEVTTGGDFNNDSYDDIAISSPYADGFGNSNNDVGEVVVLYWSDNMTQDWDLGNIATRANFTVYGNMSFDNMGLNRIVFSDVNNDAIEDLITGAPYAEEVGGLTETGVTYVLFGSEGYAPEPYEWNLWQANSRASVTIIHPDSYDYSGTWVDSFDWNNDQINDIIIGATGADGPGENLTNIGELVIINGSINLPRRIDLTIKSPGFRVIGAEADDNLGGIVTHGHLDSDAILDLVVYAEGADGINNSKDGSGEIYIIPGALSLAPNIRSMNLRNGDGLLNHTCYTKYKTYEFELNVSTPLGISDLTNLSINIDRQGLGLKYTWDRIGNNFIEVKDPGEYAEISSTFLNVTQGNEYWRISFNLEFNWSIPYSDTPYPIFVELYNSYGYHITRNFPSFFNIESRLNFSGNLSVKEEYTSPITDNAWIRGNRNITWSGLTVVYENTTNIYPLAGEYEVMLWNATDFWTITSAPGTEVNYTTKSNIDSLAVDNYKINITGLPPEKDLTNISFKFRVDANNIAFTDPEPSPAIWHTQMPVTCSITATDIGGNEVSASSIQYRTSEDNGSTWTVWQDADLSTDDVTLNIDKQITFLDGPQKLIQWRGNDTLGNGYQRSDTYMLKVDTTNLTFSNPTPEPLSTLNQLEVQFGIDIADNTSGINGSTVEYSYSLDDGTTWSDWLSAGLTGIFSSISVNATVNFTLGDHNLVKWRATDAAGNGPTESGILRINIFIETKELKAFLIRPTDNQEIGNATPKLVWECNDNSSNIVFDLYFNKTEANVENLKEPYKVGITEKSYVILEELDDKEVYYWTVIPRNITGKKGINVNGVWGFQIDLNITPPPEVPEITLIYPTDGLEVATLMPTFKWGLSYINPTGILFDLTIGTSETDLSIKITDLSVNEYILTEQNKLLNLTRYYWQIVIHGGDLTKDYYSDIWEFTTNVPPIEETYNFRLSADETSLEIVQGKEKAVNVKVKNLKDTTGTVELSIGTETTLDTSSFRFTPDTVDLAGFEEKTVLLTVSVPESAVKGDYQFTVIGIMETEKDKDDVVKNLKFQISVLTKDDVPDNGDNGETEPEDNSMMYIFLVIIIIVIIILIAFFFLRKKKEPEYVEEEPAQAMEMAAVEAEEPGPETGSEVEMGMPMPGPGELGDEMPPMEEAPPGMEMEAGMAVPVSEGEGEQPIPPEEGAVGVSEEPVAAEEPEFGEAMPTEGVEEPVPEEEIVPEAEEPVPAEPAAPTEPAPVAPEEPTHAETVDQEPEQPESAPEEGEDSEAKPEQKPKGEEEN